MTAMTMSKKNTCACMHRYPSGFDYGRLGNPTRNLFEETLAELELGAEAAAFGSGMAAIQAVFQSLASGDTVLLSDDVYHGTRHQIKDTWQRWGLQLVEVDMVCKHARRAPQTHTCSHILTSTVTLRHI